MPLGTGQPSIPVIAQRLVKRESLGYDHTVVLRQKESPTTINQRSSNQRATRFSPSMVAPASVPTWRKVTLGNRRKTALLLSALANSSFRVSTEATDALKVVAVVTLRTTLTLAKLSGYNLGFQRPVSGCEIFESAARLGLSLAPPETALQVRLQYREQPEGEYLTIGTAPTRERGAFSIFNRHGELWLAFDTEVLDLWWLPEYEWIFCLEKY